MALFTRVVSFGLEAAFVLAILGAALATRATLDQARPASSTGAAVGSSSPMVEPAPATTAVGDVSPARVYVTDTAAEQIALDRAIQAENRQRQADGLPPITALVLTGRQYDDRGALDGFLTSLQSAGRGVVELDLRDRP